MCRCVTVCVGVCVRVGGWMGGWVCLCGGLNELETNIHWAVVFTSA